MEERVEEMKVLTSAGFQTFSGIKEQANRECVLLCTDKHALTCTKDHKVKLASGDFVKVCELTPGVKLSNGESVIDVTDAGQHTVYDLLNVEGGHEYVTNGIDSHNCIALDEAALWPSAVAETFFTTTMPILSSRKNSKAIMVSTPRGTVNNKFYDIWTEANSEDKNTDGWFPFRIDWWDVPGRDEAWKNQQIATMGAQRFRQEFGNEFTSSGEALLIPDEIIHECRRKIDQGPKSILVNMSEDEKKPINAEIWKEYQPGHAYVAGADVSEGTGNDSSVVYIMDVTDVKGSGVSIAAKIASASVSVLDFANACTKLLKQYNWPTVIVENNGVGSGFVEALLYTYNVPASRVFSEMKRDGEIRYGIHSTNANKLEAALFARELLTTPEITFTIPDKHLIDEMATFIRKMNQSTITYKASGKAHDDHIMAFIWGLYLLHYRNIEKYYVVKEAFKAKQGQVLPGQLENTHEIEAPDAVTNSKFHKMVVALLNDDPTALDSQLDDDEIGDRPQEDPSTPLYYGSAGRGRSFGGKKNFVTVSESYSQLDFDRDPEKSWEDADDEDDWERPNGDNVFVGL